ncbi:hypothetical protein [Ruminococcus sp.]|nr:hypothetical protein [Ruminococcus sp.]MBQ8966422.1 hypothetical protein [Ruminococcus sp.]
MSKRRKAPLPVDPVDGTKVYTPLGERFSAGEALGAVVFDEAEENDMN